jgi:hypothetical protein
MSNWMRMTGPISGNTVHRLAALRAKYTLDFPSARPQG